MALGNKFTPSKNDSFSFLRKTKPFEKSKFRVKISWALESTLLRTIRIGEKKTASSVDQSNILDSTKKIMLKIGRLHGVTP